MAKWHIYIMANKARIMTVGVSPNLQRSVFAHKQAPLNATLLVYFNTYDDVRACLAEENRIRNLTWSEKVALVETTNAGWRDLSADL